MQHKEAAGGEEFGGSAKGDVAAAKASKLRKTRTVQEEWYWTTGSATLDYDPSGGT